jgi:hypothetical protein
MILRSFMAGLDDISRNDNAMPAQLQVRVHVPVIDLDRVHC